MALCRARPGFATTLPPRTLRLAFLAPPGAPGYAQASFLRAASGGPVNPEDAG